jgi:hypothetical protein
MNLTQEFGRSVTWIKEKLSFDVDKNISFFETTIRILGGLLSAFDLSGKILL